jgi:hypothetical protein
LSTSEDLEHAAGEVFYARVWNVQRPAEGQLSDSPRRGPNPARYGVDDAATIFRALVANRAV